MAFKIFRRISELLDVGLSSPADGEVLTYDSGTSKWVNSAAAGGGGGAPTDATYIVQTADGTLSAEQALGDLATGILKNTTTTGVLSIATANTDYAAASHASRHQNGGADEISIAGLDGIPTELQNHLDDATDAHDASAISILDTANDFTATDVEGALAELQADAETDAQNLADHLADTSAAHAASAVSVDSTSLSGVATDVQASLEELDNLLDDHSSRHENGGADEISIAGLDGTPTELTNHLNDTSAAHAASAISADSTTLVGTGTDVQAVLEELDNGIADHLADTTDAHDASAISVADAGSVFNATDVEAALSELKVQVATTIGGLADSPSPGQRAMLRLGSSPYHFMPLTYDSSLSKWVSEEYHGFHSSGVLPGATTTNSSATNLTGAEIHRGAIPFHKECYDAGLRLQVWYACFMDNLSGGAASAISQVRVRELADGDTAGTDIWQSAEVTVVGSTGTQRIIAWGDITHTTGPSDAAGVGMLEVFGRTGGSGTARVSLAFCKYRWVAAAA